MEPAPETDIKDIAGLKQMALSCQTRLHQLSEAEEAELHAATKRDDSWASRRFADFMGWCTSIGIYGDSYQSVGARVKDVPEFCSLIGRLLRRLEQTLNELQRNAESREQKNFRGGSESEKSDASSVDSRSFSDCSEEECPLEDAALSWDKQNMLLEKDVQDILNLLRGHELCLDQAAAGRRRDQIELYRRRCEHKAAYVHLTDLTIILAKRQLPHATATMRRRLAESFMRRRIRFDYLTERRNKELVGLAKPGRDKSPEATVFGDEINPTSDASDQQALPEADVHRLLTSGPQDSSFVVRQYRRIPQPPPFLGASFQCPYCQLELPARMAEKDQWSDHVMKDFEPYFCTVDDCKTPFNVSNTFDGFLRHLQVHVEELFYIWLPDGRHLAMKEKEFEEYFKRGYGDDELPEDQLRFFKQACRQKLSFKFDSCAFCGCYPNVLRQHFPDPSCGEAQTVLRRHIRQHMEDLALFLPTKSSEVYTGHDDDKISKD